MLQVKQVKEWKTMTKIETRSMEVRAVDNEKEMLLEGYAFVFDI